MYEPPQGRFRSSNIALIVTPCCCRALGASPQKDFLEPNYLQRRKEALHNIGEMEIDLNLKMCL